MKKFRVFGGGRTKRQIQLEALAQEKGWVYKEVTKSQKQLLRDHPVYQTASVERVYNLIEGPKKRLSLCDFPKYPAFSRNFYVQGNNPQKVRTFFDAKMVSFFSAYGFYHIMSNGKELLVRQFLRPATPAEAAAMIEFGLALKEKIDG